ncbi:MAG TPA: hypothetical protein DIS94_06610 [Bacteroidetes bacterium]|nr:hypothetical protein [Bacteroidota bacterium]
MDKKQKEFHKSRREKFMQIIGKETMAIIFSNSLRTSSFDADYHFKQNKNFYYLTGFNEPNSVLILIPGGLKVKQNGKEKIVREILFVQEKDEKMETWNGKRLGEKNVNSGLGIEMGVLNSSLPEFFQKYLTRRIKNLYIDVVEMFDISGELKEYMTSFMNMLRVDAFHFQIIDAAHILGKMRKVKTEFEIEQIQKAVDITAESFEELRQNLKPGMFEYQAQALLEFNYKNRGATDNAYGTIMASGNNANTLHYETNRDKIKENDLVLIDSAAEYNYYCADITRTYPASGKFTQAQREVYEKVLVINKLCIKKVKPGVRFSAIRKFCDDLIAAALVDLKIIRKKEEAGRFILHGVGHHLGLDTHDAVPYGYGETFDNDTLRPGMVVTIEPGIYFKKGMKSVPAKYQGIGVRIEDDILVTKTGNINLSEVIKKEVKDLEKN